MKLINLLPPSEQKLIHQEKIFANVKTFLFWSFFTYAIFAGLLIGGKYYVIYTTSSVDSEIERQKAIISKQDNINLKKEIDRNNAIVSDYNTIAKNIEKWSSTLRTFANLVPQDVYVTNLSANTKTGRIDVNGVGGTRESVLLMRDNILEIDKFKNIDLPFENLKKERDVDFHYTFYLKEVLPQPAPPQVEKNTKKTNDTK